MAPRQPVSDEQRRLLRITGLMPLASVSNLVPVLGTAERSIRRMLNTLRRGGWVVSVRRGMTEQRQERWFLTRRAADLLYASDHEHPAPREAARAAFAAGHGGAGPPGFSERFAPDHEHLPHLEHLAIRHFCLPGPPRLTIRTAPGTSIRPGRPPAGEWGRPCAAWPCWKRCTA